MDKIGRKYILIIGTFLTLTIFGINVSADTFTDANNDVVLYDYDESSEQFSWGTSYLSNHPQIDIQNVGYSIDDSTLTLTMTVGAEILDEHIGRYMIAFGNETIGAYQASLSILAGGDFQNPEFYIDDATYFSNDIEGFDEGTIANPISEDGMTFSASFDIPTYDSTFEIYAVAFEYNLTQAFIADDFKVDQWYDYYLLDPLEEQEPIDDEEPIDDDDSEDEKTNGTPGFEILLVFIALIFIMFIKRKKY